MFKEFFDVLLNGRIIGYRCRECGEIICPPKSVCRCGSREFERVELSGRGRIVSYTVTYVAPAGYDGEVPYVVALVELDEGPWIVGRLDVDCERAEKEDLVGKRVEVYGKEFPSEQFYPDKKRRVVPMFRLIE